jgi:hypothetical protein
MAQFVRRIAQIEHVEFRSCDFVGTAPLLRLDRGPGILTSALSLWSVIVFTPAQGTAHDLLLISLFLVRMQMKAQIAISLVLCLGAVSTRAAIGEQNLLLLVRSGCLLTFLSFPRCSTGDVSAVFSGDWTTPSFALCCDVSAFLIASALR